MNPTQFPNMGGTGGGGMPPNVQQMQNAQMQSTNIHRQIFQALQSQGPFSGWQAQVGPEERALKVKQLVDSLRLIKPPVEMSNTIQVALSFEQKTFTQSSSNESYLAQCQEKLGRIRDTRSQQVANLANAQNNQGQNPAFSQMQMQQMQQMQQIQQMGQNLPFPPQLQHQMQASPLQQHAPKQNRMNQNQGMGMPQAQPGMQQGPNFKQNQQQRPNPHDPRMLLTKQENDAINKLAAQMAEKTSKEDLAKIRANLENMTPEQRQTMTQKGVDPLVFFFRTQATKEWRRQKTASTNGIAGLGTGGNANIALQQQHHRQTPSTMQGTHGNLGVHSGGQPNVPFLGNLDHFHGQQADGLRSQEAGQLVVPASNTQGISPEQLRLQQQQQQQMIQGQQFGQQAANRTMHPNLLAQQQQQQQMQHAHQTQQEKIQNAAQFQQQSQAHARAQAAARAQIGMQGQTGLQGVSQSNAPISMLTRPVGPRVQGAGPQGIPRPPSGATIPRPQSGGQQQLQGPHVQQQGLSAMPNVNPLPGQAPSFNPQTFQQLPKQLQDLLKTKPQSQWKEQIQQFQREIRMRQHMLQQAPNMQQAVSQPGQAPQLSNGQFLGDSTMAPAPMQQSLSAGVPTSHEQPQNMNPASHLMLQTKQRQAQQNQETLRQRQIQLQMQLQQQQQQQQQQPQPPPQTQLQQSQLQLDPIPQPRAEMSDTQLAFMDKQQFPPLVYQRLVENNNFPKQMRVWGRLKQWLSQNQLDDLTPARVLAIQRMQFEHILKNSQNRPQGNANMPGPAPLNKYQVSGQPQVQIPQNGAGLPGLPGQGQINTVPQDLINVAPVTKDDMQRARMANAQLRELPENALLGLLTSQRQKVARQRLAEAQARQNGQQLAFVPQHPGQIASAGQLQNSMTRQQSGQGINRAMTSGPNQPPPPGALIARPSSGNPGPQPPSQQSQNQAPQKNLKRGNDDDVIELPGPPQNLQTGAQRPDLVPLGGQVPPMTKEMLAKLPPQQRQQYMAIRNQNDVARFRQQIQELGREVATTFQKPVTIQNMDGPSRARIVQVLTAQETRNMLGRIDQLLIEYLRVSRDQSTVKQMMFQKFRLLSQYKPSSFHAQPKTFEPMDHFSISAEDAENTVQDLLAKFRFMMQKHAEFQHAQQARLAQGQVQQLTPDNLKQLEQQERARVQKGHGQRVSDVPPAPIVSQPPVSFGDSRGHGTPRYAPGLKQEDLKLDPKRRKRNPPGTAGSTPATTHGTPGPATSPQVTQAIQAKKSEERPFKCAVVSCEHHTLGFASKIDLDSHVASAHKPAFEPVEDPLAFLLENVRKGLGLDDNGQARVKTRDATQVGLRAPPMLKTISKASSSTNVKQESKPATPAAMARGVSHTGAKESSHASNLLKTPQLASPQAAPGSRKHAKERNAKTEALQEPAMMIDDLWTEASVSLDTLQETFGDFDMEGLATDRASSMDVEAMMALYIQSDAWTKMQEPRASPAGDSSNESLTQNSTSDHEPPSKSSSKTGDLFVNVDGFRETELGESWVLPELPGSKSDDDWGHIDIDELSVEEEGDQQYKEIDWDTLLAEEGFGAPATKKGVMS